eukprot:5911153-Pleurochrysis_carterae.AAC.8
MDGVRLTWTGALMQHEAAKYFAERRQTECTVRPELATPMTTCNEGSAEAGATTAKVIMFYSTPHDSVAHTFGKRRAAP